MKLQLGLFTFLAALVAQIMGAVDPRLMMSMMRPLTTAATTTSSRQAYRTSRLGPPQQQNLSPHQQQNRRLQQELALLHRLKAMTPDQIRDVQKKLSPTQQRQLVSRIKYLKEQQARLAQQGTKGGGGGITRQNMVLSGASKVRNPSASSNSVGSRRTSSIMARARAAASAAMARMRSASRRRGPKNPLDAINKYQSYSKKAASAITAGCTYPVGMESTMDSFLAFSSGGCSMGGAVCYMNGQSCVDVGMSIMCCPPGFSSGTLSMLNYMKQMQSFMAQFQ